MSRNSTVTEPGTTEPRPSVRFSILPELKPRLRTDACEADACEAPDPDPDDPDPDDPDDPEACVPDSAIDQTAFGAPCSSVSRSPYACATRFPLSAGALTLG